MATQIHKKQPFSISTKIKTKFYQLEQRQRWISFQHFQQYHSYSDCQQYFNIATVVVQLSWLSDTSGQENFERLRKLAYTSTDIVLISFSKNSRTSFENVFKKVEVYSFSGFHNPRRRHPRQLCSLLDVINRVRQIPKI